MRTGSYRRLNTKDSMLLKWCWIRLLRVPWTIRRSNQSIPKEISHEYLLEGLMLKLKLQYFAHLMPKANSLEKTLVLGKIKGSRRRGQQRMRWLYDVTDSMNVSLSKLQEIVKDQEAWRATVHGITKSRAWPSNQTTTIGLSPTAIIFIHLDSGSQSAVPRLATASLGNLLTNAHSQPLLKISWIWNSRGFHDHSVLTHFPGDFDACSSLRSTALDNHPLRFHSNAPSSKNPSRIFTVVSDPFLLKNPATYYR